VGVQTVDFYCERKKGRREGVPGGFKPEGWKGRLYKNLQGGGNIGGLGEKNGNCGERKRVINTNKKRSAGHEPISVGDRERVKWAGN